jgi:Domain of unknown function (DUF4276)
MPRIEILTEEPSMKEVLEHVLPKILPDKWILEENYFIRAHEGKSDLLKSIPRKIKVFSYYHEPAGVVIVQDQDSADCKILKEKLVTLCQQHGNCAVLVRIVCRELESWYLGDMKAIEKAYPTFKLAQHQKKSKFREPDTLNNAAQEIRKILPEFQKISSAKLIASHLDISENANTSESFRQFVSGVTRFFDQF